jgi:hypothetical protein
MVIRFLVLMGVLTLVQGCAFQKKVTPREPSLTIDQLLRGGLR